MHGMKKNIVAPQVEEVIKTGLGIRSEDWCNRTVTILEEQVSPVALRELSYPAQLEAFEHKAVQVGMLLSLAMHNCFPPAHGSHRVCQPQCERLCMSPGVDTTSTK